MAFQELVGFDVVQAGRKPLTNALEACRICALLVVKVNGSSSACPPPFPTQPSISFLVFLFNIKSASAILSHPQPFSSIAMDDTNRQASVFDSDSDAGESPATPYLVSPELQVPRSNSMPPPPVPERSRGYRYRPNVMPSQPIAPQLQGQRMPAFAQQLGQVVQGAPQTPQWLHPGGYAPTRPPAGVPIRQTRGHQLDPASPIPPFRPMSVPNSGGGVVAQPSEHVPEGFQTPPPPPSQRSQQENFFTSTIENIKALRAMQNLPEWMAGMPADGDGIGNIGCTNCATSVGCVNSVNLQNCTGCLGCVDCVNCYGCVNCISCSGLVGKSGVMNEHA